MGIIYMIHADGHLKRRILLNAYTPIEIDYENYIIRDISFSYVDNTDAAIIALGTVMNEWFYSPQTIEFIRDYLANKIILGQLTKEKPISNNCRHIMIYAVFGVSKC